MSRKYEIDGVYYTPAGNNPYTVFVEGNAINCIAGQQHPDGNANVVFAQEGLTVDGIINAAIKFLESKKDEGIRIGSIQGASIPNTFEEFLRNYSNVDRLGSFFPPILVKLGLAEYFRPTGGGALWIKAVDRKD